MRGLHTPESARLFMDGWLVHYNFFRPHMSLNDRTPASVAGIKFPYRNWKDVVEQPYEKTARIPLRKVRPIIQSEPKPRRKTRQTSKHQIKRKRRVAQKDPSASYYLGHKLRDSGLKDTKL